jgi:hypothetical protein
LHYSNNGFNGCHGHRPRARLLLLLLLLWLLDTSRLHLHLHLQMQAAPVAFCERAPAAFARLARVSGFFDAFFNAVEVLLSSTRMANSRDFSDCHEKICLCTLDANAQQMHRPF